MRTDDDILASSKRYRKASKDYQIVHNQELIIEILLDIRRILKKTHRFMKKVEGI